MRYILASHGPFAKAALTSAEMIVGEQENVDVLEVGFDTTLDGMKGEIIKVIKKKETEEYIIFCDILGGTPFNASIKVLHEFPNLSIVTGFNLPMLIEIFMSPLETKQQLLEKIRMVYPESLNIFDSSMLEKEEEEAYEL
ncbi:PTS sugar transporter subunit IIA [Enterococcus sp. DIV0756]|uniref:PTS sugar transporter subunit IIA n=1 Tax=Enterococcus sp. DIV0756 TaxID=2774636 RepID=UPI003F29D104